MRKVCGENVVVAEGIENINFNKLIHLNPTAAYLWEEVETKEFTVDTLAELLLQKYEVDRETAVADSEKLAQSWRNAGVLED